MIYKNSDIQFQIVLSFIKEVVQPQINNIVFAASRLNTHYDID